MAIKIGSFWAWAALSVAFRLALIGFADVLNLGSRPEIATPLTSLRRLAEGYWLKQSSMSPYAGSMYHGSPLLLSLLGPLTAKRIGGQSNQVLACLLFVIADFSTAMLIRAIGDRLQLAYSNSLTSLGVSKLKTTSSVIAAGDVSALIYLWNPMTIVTCLGYSSTPIENLMVILSIFGACAGLVPLAAFGWVMASHLSLYPTVLVIPVVLLLGFGPDSPPRKLFCTKICQPSGADLSKVRSDQPNEFRNHYSSFLWRPVLKFMLWASVWSMYVFGLCAISLKENGGLSEMFSKTYGFILTVPDLSPNIGVLWYFFAEVFDSFRVFFLLVFHMNIIYMILPLAIRLNHRPCFLAFLYIVVYSMLKSYPSVGDSALYLGLLGLFINELSDMHLSYFLFCGYIGVSLLSPVMHNLWIWRGTGNANFYFATAIAYACLQIILLVEGVSSMLKHDRLLKGKTLSESS